jgi:PII-like signaling protein
MEIINKLPMKSQSRIKTSFLTAVLVFAASTGWSSADELKNLEPFAWSNRIILVHETSDEEHAIARFTETKPEIIDRDIIWFVIHQNTIATNYEGKLDEHFAQTMISRFFKNNHNKVVLIGKDGTVKGAYGSLDLAAIFALIDTMPMRQQEMSQ